LHLDFKKNVGNAGRLIRTIAGIVLLTLVDIRVITGWWAKAAVGFSLFLFIEAFLAY